MKTSTRGLMALIAHEGIVLSRYKDSVGVWTIGVGHTKAAGGINPELFSGTLTIDQVLDTLRDDLVKYEAGVNKAVTVPLQQHEFDALVSFHYNTGAIAKASFVKALNAGDRAAAYKGIMSWNKPAEILKRRAAERDLLQYGKYPEPYANIYPASKSGQVLWGKGERVSLDAYVGGRVNVDDPGPRSQTTSGNWLATLIKVIAAAFGAKK